MPLSIFGSAGAFFSPTFRKRLEIVPALLITGLKKISVLLLLLCTSQLHTQTIPNYQLLTTADGLSQGMVFDILQSRDGFIWIATKDGLNRYDGSRFEVFSPNPFDPFAIGNSEARMLFEDSRGWIWVGLADGLDVLDPLSGRFFHVMHEGKPLSSFQGGHLAETPDGAIWLSGQNRIWGISVKKDMLSTAVKRGTADLEPPCKAIPLANVSSGSDGPLRAAYLLFTKENKLLVGTSSGLYRVDFENQKVELEGLPNEEIFSMCQSPTGHILVRNGSSEFKKITIWNEKDGIQNSRSIPIQNNNYISNSSRNTIFDSAGFLWLTQYNVLQRYPIQGFLNNTSPDIEWPFEQFLYQHAGFNFHTLFVDRSGMLWLGTNGFGVFKVNLQGPTFKSYLPKSTQRKIVEDPKGNLITAHDIHVQYGSTHFDQIEPNRSFYHARDYPWQLSVLFDPDGNCWVTDPGEPLLYRTDAQSKEKKAYPWKGIGLGFNPKGHLLSVSGEGLYDFDPATEQSSFYPFKTPMQQSTEFSQFFWKDSAGVMWVFGFEGLIRAIPSDAGYQFEYFVNNPKDRSSLSSNVVLSVADDPLEPEKYLWVGTRGGGLNRLDKKTGKFKQYNKEQGLPDNVVYGILAESPTALKGGRPFIWLSTNKGLCRFDVRAETAKNFTAADGLQDNEFNSSSYLKTRNGTMIFGGIKGLTVFHPDSLRFNEYVPQTRIVGLKVNNQKFDFVGKSSIVLSHDQNLLTFDFAALEFTNPAQNQYRYQLVGVDKDWVSLGYKNSIQFANLAPGTYTFRVLGSNNDGIWSEQAAELRFTIRPPLWATWWAYLAYFALIAAGVWWYYQYLLRQRFSEQEKLRLKELDDFKSRFFTNITHEFRTPLTVMLGMSEQLAKEEKDEPKRNKLGLIKRSGENLLRLVNQILDLAKLETNALKMNYIQGDILVFIRYIAESLHSLANAQNLLLRVESDQAKIVMDYDPERFLQIIHNLLSNAIKFTPSGGKVLLQVDVKDQWLHISVVDSGAGIPPEELPQLFERFFQARNQEHAKAGGTGIGLSLTRELVKAMGGEISVESTVGVGSTFLVKLPVTNNSVFDEMTTGRQKLQSANQQFAHKPINEPSVVNEQDRPNILLVEDNPDVVEYLTVCLQGVGDHEGRPYVLDFAYNGQAGIEKALETIPDLIVSDVMMPFKDGFEVVEALKNDERTSHIPIILLTAKADVQSRLTGLRRGADAYLSKPFHQEELLVTLENLLESRRKLQLKYQQQILLASPAAPECSAGNPEDSFLQKVRAIIEAHYSQEDFGLPQLCQKIGMSRSQLFRKMKALTDIAPSDLIRSHRLNKARALLESGAANAAEAAWQVGFKDPSYFSKLYQEEFGIPPSATIK